MDSLGLKIGYSYWGFLYEGIVDTPDGGRIHRLPLIKSLLDKGCFIYCLQKNRDLYESKSYQPIKGLHFCSSNELPEVDFLIVEYRWPIPGRNRPSDIGNPGYTPDYARQKQLLSFYMDKVPIIVWDKDLKLAKGSTKYEIAENALLTDRQRHKLLFSFDDELKAKAITNLDFYNESERNVDLIYIGNQYERDESFNKYINKAGAYLNSFPIVYGNWTKYPKIFEKNLVNYKNVEFRPRVHFRNIGEKYSSSFSTVLIAPDRYYQK